MARRRHGRLLVRGVALLCTLAATFANAGDRPPLFQLEQEGAEIVRFTDAVRDTSRSRLRPARIDEVEALISRALDIEDTRLLGHAEARLQALQQQPAIAIKADYLIAWIAQHRHDYLTSRRLLGSVLEREPRHLGALRARAFISHALGDVEQLRRDCVALALAGDRDYARLCSALWLYADGQLEAAIAEAVPLVAVSKDPGLHDESLRLIAEIELLRQRPVDALAAIAQLPNPRPGDLRMRLRGELAAGDMAHVLPEADNSDEALYLRALVASRTNGPDADALRRAFLARLAHREQMQDGAAAGLACEYFLDVAPDPVRARDYAARHLLESREPRALALAKRAAVVP